MNIKTKILLTPMGHGYYKWYVLVIEDGRRHHVGFDSRKRAREYCLWCSRRKLK